MKADLGVSCHNIFVTNPSFLNPRGQGPEIPQGVTLGEYSNYAEVSKAVNKLAEAEFPVKNVVIIGSDLKSIEQVTGRMNYLRSTLRGATNGIWLGLMYCLFMVVLTPEVNTNMFLAALLIGAAAGGLIGLMLNIFGRKRKGYTSVSGMLASSFVLLVAPEFAEKARSILSRPAPSETEKS